jgi:hypothetical protein
MALVLQCHLAQMLDAHHPYKVFPLPVDGIHDEDDDHLSFERHIPSIVLNAQGGHSLLPHLTFLDPNLVRIPGTLSMHHHLTTNLLLP